MNKIDLDIGTNEQKLLPVPYYENPSSVVPTASDYGKAPYGLAPSYPTAIPRTEDESQYCNFLSPAPRDPQTNVPYEGPNKFCPKFKAQPYEKDSCYLMDSKSQGVVGIVCNQSGGSDNADFVRGNQFGADYEYDFNERENRKKLEYTVERPVQVQMQLDNPLVMYDNKPNFFPFPDYEIWKNKDYLTYPRPDNYSQEGNPLYVFPDKTLNPPYDKPYSDTLKTIENFTNSEINLRNTMQYYCYKRLLRFVGFLIFVLVALYIVSVYNCRC